MSLAPRLRCPLPRAASRVGVVPTQISRNRTLHRGTAPTARSSRSTGCRRSRTTCVSLPLFSSLFLPSFFSQNKRTNTLSGHVHRCSRASTRRRTTSTCTASRTARRRTSSRTRRCRCLTRRVCRRGSRRVGRIRRRRWRW